MQSINDQDLGTPARHAAQTITLEVDGREVTVPAGTSIMRAAALADVMVPKLCASDTLEPFGSCRLCLVQIEGRNGYPASCTTPVESGMKVHTQSEKLTSLRRGVMELYMSDHPLDPFECKAGGKCELHEMARVVGLERVRYADHGRTHRELPVDESNPYFSFDPSRCIVCSRCVRACDEIQGTFALTIDGRGFNSQMSPGQHQHYSDSECVSCGACVQACPTDALMEKTVLEKGRADRAIITTCAYCGVGCSFKAEIRGDQIVRMVPNKNGLPNHGHSCVKGRFAWGYATHPDRVTKPMIRQRTSDPWREVTWDEAIATPPANSSGCSAGTVVARSAESRRRAAPTKRLTSYRSWCARPSATITSTPAPGFAIRRPVMDSRPLSARRRGRRILIPCWRPT